MTSSDETAITRRRALILLSACIGQTIVALDQRSPGNELLRTE